MTISTRYQILTSTISYKLPPINLTNQSHIHKVDRWVTHKLKMMEAKPTTEKIMNSWIRTSSGPLTSFLTPIISHEELIKELIKEEIYINSITFLNLIVVLIHLTSLIKLAILFHLSFLYFVTKCLK